MCNVNYIKISTAIIFSLAAFASQMTAAKLTKKKLNVLHKWTTHLPMTFPTDEYLKLALENEHYISDKPLPVDVDIEYGDNGYHRTFLTIPRLSVGIPYSLANIADNDTSTVLNPKLMPYPSYEWHSSYGLNCSGITSAIRTFIDECWRLWVIDLGQINSLQYCAPQILAFDLVTDQLVHRYILPAGLYKPGVSVFTALAIDVGGIENAANAECVKTMVYIADPWGYGLIVYDVLARRSWRIEHSLMHPEEYLQKQNSAVDGIFTISISPKTNVVQHEKVRKLYFHALNSYLEISVPLDVVNNASLWSLNNATVAAKAFEVLGSRGIQCESEIMDRGGNLYCSLISSNALITWNENNTVYNSDTLKVVAYNPLQLKYVTGLKVNRNTANEDEIWALSSEPMLFIGAGARQSQNMIRIQILGCRTKNLIDNDICTVQALQQQVDGVEVKL